MRLSQKENIVVRSTKSGFTLVEAAVIILIVGLMAAAIVPRLLAFTRSNVARSFVQKLAAIGGEARELAITTNKPVDLEYDSGANQFKLHTLDAEGADKYLDSLTVTTGLQTARFMLGTKDSDPGSWKLMFYPDGSSDGGGVQLTQQNDSLSLYVDSTTGYSAVTHDQLPDPTILTWTAGDYVHRATS
jgi:type II secretion system protein H